MRLDTSQGRSNSCPRMAEGLNLPASVRPWLLEPREGFGPSLSHAWLDSPGPMTDLALRDQREHSPTVVHGGQAARNPLCPQLDGVLEAQCVFRSIVTDRFGIVTAEFGNVTDRFGDVTDGVLKAV